MSKRKKADDDLTVWTVEMEVTRYVTVRVAADTEEEARTKAEESDIIGDEQPGDTINQKIIGVERE